MASSFLAMEIKHRERERELERKPETMKQKGKKKEKKPSQKKEPQRGLGVATLERLRYQERLKMMSGTDQVTPPNLQFQFPVIPYFDHAANVLNGISNGLNGVPFGRFASSPMSFNGGGENQSSFIFPPYRYRNDGGVGVVGAAGGVFVSGCTSSDVQPVITDRYDLVDRYRNRNQEEERFVNVNRYQTRSELPSTQIHCVSDYCDVCFKKKRLNGEILTCGNEKMSASDLLALSLGRNNNSSSMEEKQVEVVPFHHSKGAAQAGNGVMKAAGGGNVFKEYEFFPGSTTTTASEEAGYGGQGGGGEASSSSSANVIDLSLKLSW